MIQTELCPKCQGNLFAELGDIACIICGWRGYTDQSKSYKILQSNLGDALPDKFPSSGITYRCEDCGRWLSLARAESHASVCTHTKRVRERRRR